MSMADTPEVDVRALAALSRIRVEEDAIPALTTELSGILAFIEEVRAIELPEPSAQHGLRNVMREDGDAYEPGRFTEALLDAAPERRGEYLAVKQVLSHVKKNAA
ncbi:MAG TPA: Asp-tRNA(Asn)/Glu-tRNA(Gln) amidotransferase subunit GatC [Candidatus Paceibacterota bacterium]|nr:Asp-tRNA(Asn)/Glu-tRNA(Gln) amidotransferase subunit GatC [Candidatus Paceibacterota bacterium]